MTAPGFALLVGEPPPRCKSPTLIVVTRKPRSKWTRVVCFGQKSHYRSDGSCIHTDALLANWKQAGWPVERVRIDHGWKVKEQQDAERRARA